ncbi:hypothetical protein KRX19_05465 [Cardiobacteriaceae bacterium TAE3-ERU3]|nr:hypothetical protein [Cardiobacteriaceae bacterium TAE3-ERU3]
MNIIDTLPYLAVVFLPVPPTPEALEAGASCFVKRLVGEYYDASTADEKAYKAAVEHGADGYSVVFPSLDDDYKALREKLKPLVA